MTVHRTGWIKDSNDDRDYLLETVISKLTPQEIETQAQNIKLERALFAEDDNSPMLKRAMRLVPKEEWNAKRKRYRQLPYLILPFVKEDGHEENIKALRDQDLFLKESVDLRPYFSQVSDQENMQTCTAHAGKALMEYFQNRASGNFDNQLSWQFLYKVTRDLIRLDQDLVDGGATIRDTLRAMVLFGVPPQKSDKNWLATEEANVATEKLPSTFAYAYAQNFQASNYFRLDKLRENYNQGLLTIEKKNENDDEVGQLTVAQIRIALASGFPSIFGISNPFILSDFITQSDLEKIEEENKNTQNKKKKRNLGQIKVLFSPTPTAHNIGHALVAVGYDDNLEFDDPNNPQTPLKGGFLFRDSQGEKWGDKGYGWLPYYYVEKGLATDWWSLLNAEWINTSGFGIGIDQILGCKLGCTGAGCC